MLVINSYRFGGFSYSDGLLQYNPLAANSNATVGVNGTDTSISYGSHGDFQNSADFTASTSSQISLGDNDNFTLGTDWTVHVRFNLAVTGNPFLFGKRGTTTNLEYQVAFIGGFATLRCRFFTDASNYRDIAHSAAYSTSTWYSVTITSISGNLKLYLNGSDTGETQSDTGTYTGMSNGTNPLILGKYEHSTTLSLNGYLGEFAIWNYGMNATQVANIPTPIL